MVGRRILSDRRKVRLDGGRFVSRTCLSFLVFFVFLVTQLPDIWRKISRAFYLRPTFHLYGKTPNRARACLELSFTNYHFTTFFLLSCLIFRWKHLQPDITNVMLVTVFKFTQIPIRTFWAVFCQSDLN